MPLPTLYSLTSLGQTQTWSIETKGARFRTTEGILGGVLTTSAWTQCQGKNVGRANETTGEEQAEREAKSRHQRKLDSGYHEDQAAISTPRFFEPMLAKQWEDHKDTIEWPVYSQPKLDGVRCIASKDGLFSRNGKRIVSAPHIEQALADLFNHVPSLRLDGELYCHRLKHDFNAIISLAKKTKPTEADLAESAAHLEYWVYDVCDDHSVRHDTFRSRLAQLLPLQAFSVKVVPTALAANLDELDTLYASYLDDGFEGQMARAPNGLYETKRSRHLLKRKLMQDGEFQLVDIESGRGGAAHHAARAILKTDAGVVFEAGIIGNHEHAAALLKDRAKLIGRRATVVYQNLTPDGKPRFAKLKTIRDYE